MTTNVDTTVLYNTLRIEIEQAIGKACDGAIEHLVNVVNGDATDAVIGDTDFGTCFVAGEIANQIKNVLTDLSRQSGYQWVPENL